MSCFSFGMVFINDEYLFSSRLFSLSLFNLLILLMNLPDGSILLAVDGLFRLMGEEAWEITFGLNIFWNDLAFSIDYILLLSDWIFESFLILFLKVNWNSLGWTTWNCWPFFLNYCVWFGINLLMSLLAKIPEPFILPKLFTYLTTDASDEAP